MKLCSILIKIFIPVVLVGFDLFSCQGGSGTDPSKSGSPGSAKGGHNTSISVQVVEILESDLVSQNNTSGAVTPVVTSSVAANCTGVIKSVPRVAGDWVEKDAVIARLDDTQLQVNLKLAQTNLDNARINMGLPPLSQSQTATTVQGQSKLELQLESMKSALASAQKTYESDLALFKIGGIAESDLDNAQNLLQTAQANLENAKMTVQQTQISLDAAVLQLQQAQINLDYAVIRAPFAGQISAIDIQPGEYVNPNTVAFVLVSNTRQVNFNVPPSDIAGLGMGTEVNFNYQGKDYRARISQLPGAPVNGLVPLVAFLDSSVNLNYGTVGTVTYKVKLAHGLIVPVNALLSTEGSPYVFLVKDNKTIQQNIVILGQSGASAAVSGFSAPAYVVINPPPGLLPGATVEPIASAEAPPDGATTTTIASNQDKPKHHKHQEDQ